MGRLPLLSGSRLPLASVTEETVVLMPPGALDPLRDVAAAVGEALRYPLSGPPLAELVTRGGRATIVVEPRSLPLPGSPVDPRPAAVAAVIDELERLGMAASGHTILVAGGLERRVGRRRLDAIVPPSRARGFRGQVSVHDATAPELRVLEVPGSAPVRVHPALLDADLIVTVSAAETSERGGACTLLAACGAETIAAPPPAPSLLAPSLSPAGVLAGRVSAALARQTPVIGVSVVLDHPRLLGRFRGYPSSPDAVEAVAHSHSRRLLNLLPGGVRDRVLQGLARELAAAAVLAGPPPVAHAEALLRGISLRGIPLASQLDTLVVPIPWKSLHEPREPLNPITVAAIGLGHAMRLWRDGSPLREGGTIVLLHDLRRTFRHGQAPYRDLFHLLREGPTPSAVAAAGAAAAADERAVAAYRRGDAPHPLLPYLDWASCGPALARAGRVLVGGCRDAGAARALGLVPTHSIPAALEMAAGVAGDRHAAGVLLAPPYAPVVLGGDEAGA